MLASFQLGSRILVCVESGVHVGMMYVVHIFIPMEKFCAIIATRLFVYLINKKYLLNHDVNPVVINFCKLFAFV